jgi:hypothetical protein
LIALVLISGYRRAVAAFAMDPTIGGLMLAYIVVSAVYSITESGFRSLQPMWIFLLLAIFNASGVVAGLIGGDRLVLESGRHAFGSTCDSAHVSYKVQVSYCVCTSVVVL